MPFTSSNPQTQEVETFDLLGISLITSPNFLPKAVGARVVLRIDPYRIDGDGNVRRPMVQVGDALVVDESASRTMSWPDAYKAAQTDPALALALSQISAALQQYINAKGL